MRNINIPKGLDGADALRWIKANKSILIAEKKMRIKQADAVCFSGPLINKDGDIIDKAQAVSETTIRNSTVINSCYWYDSHGDVHIPGIWNKSLAEKRSLYLLQEHKMTFDHIITDKVTPRAEDVSWKKLGVDIEGKTQALIFDNEIDADRNPFMFNQYAKGRVKNHSVGMYYVKIDLAVNDKSKDFEDEYTLWSKHIDKVANKEEAIADGFMWIVSEARIVEGSAVPIGSNIITPTLGIKNTQDEPGDPTQDEPLEKKSWFSQIQ